MHLDAITVTMAGSTFYVVFLPYEGQNIGDRDVTYDRMTFGV